MVKNSRHNPAKIQHCKALISMGELSCPGTAEQKGSTPIQLPADQAPRLIDVNCFGRENQWWLRFACKKSLQSMAAVS